MHFIFIPYGVRTEIEFLLREMEHQKFQLIAEKDGKKQVLWINGGIRLLPFGVYEYVFPKKYLDVVLNTLMPTGTQRYKVGWIRTKILEKLLKCEAVPQEWAKTEKFVWAKQFVNIIPIGIRHDGETTSRHYDGFNLTMLDGWKHEAL